VSDDQCRICGSDGDRSVYAAGESMFGTGEVFHYAECSKCGWLQLLDVPEDLAPYYPNGYYSFGNPPPVDGRFERMAKTIRTELVLRGPEWGTRMLPMSWRPGWRGWFRGVLPSRSAPIIDVGSGSGHTLTFLHNDGFTNLVGYDPFLEFEQTAGPVPLYRKVPDKFWGTFALAMMHHSLEHAMDHSRRSTPHGGSSDRMVGSSFAFRSPTLSPGSTIARTGSHSTHHGIFPSSPRPPLDSWPKRWG
jgi:hypothetical protein